MSWFACSSGNNRMVSLEHLVCVLLPLMFLSRTVLSATMQMTRLYYNEVRMPWNSAFLTCSHYGELVNIHNQAIQSAVNNMMNKYNKKIWIGLHDQGGTTRNDWRWSDCEELQTTWVDWALGEPQDSDTRFCIYGERSTEKWRTMDCENGLQNSICAKTEGECTYERHLDSDCELEGDDGIKKTFLLESGDQLGCDVLCNNETMKGKVCWASEFDDKESCTLIYSSNPYVCNDHGYSGSTNLSIRNCFTFDSISEKWVHPDEQKSTPALVCDPTTSETSLITTSESDSASTASTASIPSTTLLDVTFATTTDLTPEFVSLISFTPEMDTVSEGDDLKTAVPQQQWIRPTEISDFGSHATMTEFRSQGVNELPSLFPSPDGISTDKAASARIQMPATTGSGDESPNLYHGSSSISSLSVFATSLSVLVDITATPTTVSFHTSATLTETTDPTPPSMSPWNVSTTEITTSEGIRNLCTCLCFRGGKLNSTLDIQGLILSKKNLSSFRRKLDSAVDDRPSAKSIGASGVILLIIPIVILILLDINRFY